MYLSRLKIDNFALVDSLDAEFEPGLLAVTGETGAGKSMILGSLQLLLGGRADIAKVRKGEKKAVVQGVFETLAPNDKVEKNLKKQLRDSGFEIEDDEPVIIKREVSASGKSAAQIAGNLISIKQLAEFTDSLIDIHSQHDQQSLMKRIWQQQTLDAFAGAEETADKVKTLFSEWRVLLAEIEDKQKHERELRQREDILKYQLKEINDAKLVPGEEKELLEKESFLANSEEIVAAAASISSSLNDEDFGVISKLQNIQRELSRLNELDSRTVEWSELLSQSLINIDDFERQLSSYKDKLEVDPKELLKVQDRLHLISQLKKKYGNSEEEILNYAIKIDAQLQESGSFDENIKQLEKEADDIFRRLQSAANKLGEKRKKTAAKLQKEMEKELEKLGMKNAEFIVDLAPYEEITSYGNEKVEFKISVNPGEDPKPLGKVASGGELSRITLALKCIVTTNVNLPVMVFDEIDAGVSGSIAHAVGERLQKLGEKHQIFAITHMPQIACRGESHFVVEKSVVKERTSVTIKKLNINDKEKEIARMLGGESKTAIAHAKELFAKAKK